MKFSKSSQLILVSSIGLLVATLLTACSITTADFVYVANSEGSTANGKIECFAVDAQSGALRTANTVVSSGGVDPVAMAVSADYGNIYVANAGSNTVTHFTIALSGALTAADSIPVTAPVALAVNTAGTYLYVVSGSTSATLNEYPLTSGKIGQTATATETLSLTPYYSYHGGGSYGSDILVPTGVAVLANNGSDIKGNAVYVTLYDKSAYNPTGQVTSTANPGWVFGFAVGSGGSLSTASSGIPFIWQAGIKPSAIAADPTDRFVYITDFESNQLIGYTILDVGITDTLSFMTSGPFKTGNEPTALAIDPRGKFIYVTNSLDNSLSAYEITMATGVPTASVNATGSGNNGTSTQPIALTIDPALGRFVYTANYLDNSVSGFRLDPTSGSLSATQSTPYPSGNKPTTLVSIPHGNHAIQTVAP
jgi:6-phosphogluconolactonase (cycloisomerase 2 family)